ncbi:TIGR03016 family PEP-CTERM system-associated outer membrane protein [Azospirillum canadense]|uniref:TIGR03016 family PEP-CTERM system-associated outer membrane protein n=1 Tax=Azospirillum canadense TaxID=403962 RepID=UPI002227DE41|nr:TIGR03016 family PEP-CTERM system-associated outer membrane protein [Azospirillum canadense]MCW2240897.1 hypothetical protein [Azospirillum canadense]
MPRPSVCRPPHWLALGAGLAVGGLAAPALAKPHLTPYAGAEVTLTDNIDLAPRDRRESAVVFTEFGGLSLRETNRHTNYALDGRLNLDTTVGNGTDVSLRPDVTGTGRVELVEGRLYVDGRLLSQRELIDARGRIGSSPTVGRGNQTSVTTVAVSPFLTGHIGPYADTELRYTHEDTLVDARDVGNSMTNALSWRTTSGRALPRLRLTGTLEYSATRASPSEDNLDRETALLSGEYAVTRQVFLIGSAGWERIASPGLSYTRNGLIGLGGFRYRPSPRLELELTAGQRYGGPTYNGHLSYLVTSRWTAGVNYAETLETPQTRLGRPANRITLDPQTGGLVVSDTRNLGIPRSASVVGTLRFDLKGRYTVDDVDLWFTRETRDYDVGPDETIVTSGAQWRHRLSERLALSAQAQYRHVATAGPEGDSDTAIGTASLVYTVFRDVTGSVSLSRSQRFSSRPEQRYTENTILFGLMARF